MKVTSFLRSCLMAMGLSVLALKAYAQGTTSNAPVQGSGEHKDWKQQHPRRAEVNKRLNNQHRRIHQGVKNGTLTKQEAAQFRGKDRQIRQEERSMASQNGGHITKTEQKALNQQENAESKQIHQEKHDSNSTN